MSLSSPSLAQHQLSSHIERAAFLDDTPAFACADGTVHVLGGQTHEAHDGLTCAAAHGDALLTGGEDGAVRLVRANGIETLHEGDDWIDALASGPRGALAWSAGRNATVRTPDGARHELAFERSVEGLAFAPKGLRVLAARYGAVEARYPLGGRTETYEWKGAHLAASVSPDGAFLVSVLQENALHGWRLADGVDMAMRGYPAKVRDLSWSSWGKADRFLATAGATCAVLWPFDRGEDRKRGPGPMGRQPLLLSERADSLTIAVACHPKDGATAIGYRDGMVMFARHGDGAEVMLRRPGKGAVTTLAWDRSGMRLAFGTEGGEAGIVSFG